MAEIRQQWFKVWASEALLSDDLDDLSDHEERVWWRLVMVASLENERWTVEVSEKTARKCHTKLPKLIAAVENFSGRGMLSALGDGWFAVTNGHKWNEDTERKKKPSDSKERVNERVTRHRNALRNAALQENGNAAHKEEEKEEEEEKEKSISPLKRGATRFVLSEEDKCKLLQEYPGSEETIELALSHKSHLNYPNNQYGYVRNWLRRDASERTNGNGTRRQGTHSHPPGELDPEIAAAYARGASNVVSG